VNYGAIISIADSVSAEVIGRGGFDWLCIDQQHGAVGDEGLFRVLQATGLGATPCLVRVRWNEPAQIMRALDAGALGVIVPMVETPEQAASVVNAAKFPPTGSRSWGPIRARYSMTDYTPKAANEHVLCAVMIETSLGLENVDAIAAVPGLDAIFVGPSDLALSLGFTPNLVVSEPRVVESIGKIATACRNSSIAAGIFTTGASEGARWRDAGFTIISVHSDRLLMAEAANATLARVRSDSLSTEP